ncbi:uncharacterized protein EI90DRAFT_2922344 [Cantharellus anzutake]|uniref:uncharacterized protein n=1 Tax=Cantharellus anzutake TaxID=1750568 RepID=UPI001908B117|nr:uncharacterized protein EI90DRAFT_1046902 [Cantharellus anzutake]XP_038915542.1 uncharacterized protein EI90DRAFT_2922344 [Cantharellus anzutake]KAF8311129.1 hypothetical protein EI90DRAFT_1046902 [Cantharellus anzutake]KAF8330454.1 hypothetical protein EI90DRAFT_2922344 [Cantharellus anzutake]
MQPPGHFILFGSTGPSGLKIIELALSRGNYLTLYVRSPDKLPEDVRNSPLVRVVVGQLDDEAALESCFSKLEDFPVVKGIISVLGAKVGQPQGNPITKGYEIIFKLMKMHDIKNIVLLSTVSVKSPKDHFSLVRESLVAGIKLIGHSAWEDVVATGELVHSEASDGLNVTLARVPTLNDSKGGSLKVGFVGDRYVGWLLSRNDLATFFVGEAEKPEWAGEIPLLSS